MSSSADSIHNALWTTTSREPIPRADPFEEGRVVDVVVIGGGFTGLSAALSAAEAGATVVLLEERHIAWGASGRNGGQVIPGLKIDPSEMQAAYGEVAGSSLADAVGRGPDLVFDLITRLGIDCQPQRIGWIQAAHAERALQRVQRRGREWKKRGAAVELLDAAAVARLTGTQIYCGGWRDNRAGTLQPLAYARGLARGAQRARALIHEGVRATSLVRRNDVWQIGTTVGTLRGKHVIVGQDGYCDGLIDGLAQTLICVQSALVATAPLPPALRSKLMPNGICASETRRLAFYFRQSPDGRLVFGGRGAIGDRENPTFFKALVAAMCRSFPEVQHTPIDHSWSGQVAVTLDGLPHLHEPQPGLLIGLGYNGRGIAMATLVGSWLAAKALHGVAPPLPITPITPIPFHRFRRSGIQMALGWAWFRDRMGYAG